ncbi:MAG: L,D-transpeptidase [bacterium]
MRKKVTHRKPKAPHPSFFLRYSVGAVIALTLALLLYPFLTTKNTPCANTISCKTPPKFEMETNAIGIYNNQPVHVPNIYISKNENISPVLGEKTSNGEKHIYVNLTTEILTAYEGDTLFMQTPISSGLWGKTPKGDFTIWTKFRSTRMSGGSGADYYDLPNVPYVMFFSNDEIPGSSGFSIHGTYWHNNFGHAMSHGCVNMKTTDVARLYDWADGPSNGNKGTKITIYEP